ncbi:hypothetical protein C7421_104370 [Pantoea ananatis]|nr:hypothetical protein C7421_104370 [Pantoea ananatis]
MSEIPAEDVCSTCQQPLHDSVIIEKDGEVFKSCPSCSSNAGTHVFYKYDDFGMRNMGDGRFIVQSWCQRCRLKDSLAPVVSFTC